MNVAQIAFRIGELVAFLDAGQAEKESFRFQGLFTRMHEGRFNCAAQQTCARFRRVFSVGEVYV